MTDEITEARREAAEATKRTLVEIATRAHEEAGLSGLCEEGRWEAALGAMRNYDVRQLASELT
jgi:hypothetical protein